MLLKTLVYVWLLITLLFAWEYAQMHRIVAGPMLLEKLFCEQLEWCKKINPEPGETISYALGWLGFGVMCMTNVYVLRKRYPTLLKFGKPQTYLDWHIFFGLLGPTFIVFHCDFQVRGLVAISFWSMVVSFLSGIVGRYFYLQLLQKKTSLKTDIDQLEKGFHKYVQVSGQVVKQKHMDLAKAHVFHMALGGVGTKKLANLTLAQFLFFSLKGDLSLYFHMPETPWPGGRIIRKKLREWAFMRRRLIFMHYYKMMFGYWRTFHTPFAVFMYIVAIIHIVSSLIFRVK